MGAAAARDLVTLKVANLAAVDHAYGNGTHEDVEPIPPNLIGNAVNALVLPLGTRLSDNGTQYIRDFAIEFHFPALDRGAAGLERDTLDDQMLVEFTTGVFLGAPSTYLNTWYRGSDPPILQRDSNGTEWWMWLARVEVRERYPQATP